MMGHSAVRVGAGGAAGAVVGLVAMVLVGAGPVSAKSGKHGKHSVPPLVYARENGVVKMAGTPVVPFEQLPEVRTLPDPFRFANGSRDASFAAWERHRAEIRAAIERYEIGPKPDCADCTVTATYVPAAAGAEAKGTLTVMVTRQGRSLTLTSGVYVPPSTGTGKMPALVAVTYKVKPAGPNYGALPAAAFAAGPVVTVDFVHDQVAAYTRQLSSHAADPFYVLYPELCAGVCSGGTSNSGEYAAWSWGVSRLLDGIAIAAKQAQNPLPVDVSRVGVTGCSYAGKMALFAGAFDERIALTVSQENGGGGAAAWRASHELEAKGTVEKIDNTDYDWFGGQMKQFAGDNVYKLPEDHDELMDMVAPRALLETGNTDFKWLSNRSNDVSARAAAKVYEAFGVGDRFGFWIDGGHGHCQVPPAEVPVVAAFVDRFLLGDGSAKTDVRVSPFAAAEAARWSSW